MAPPVAPSSPTAPVAPAPPTAQARPRRRQPPTLPLPPAPARSPRRPPHGDDAAYEAFDQGKYLTALELGLKAAANGDPQAHTLVGRIYEEGSAPRRTWRLPPSGTPAAPSSAMPRRCSRSPSCWPKGRACRRIATRPRTCSRRRRKSTRSPTTIWRCCSSRATASRKIPIAPPCTCGLPPRPACGGAIRSRHAVRDRHRRRAQRVRGCHVDRQGRGSRPPRGAGRLCRHAVPRPGRAPRPQGGAACSARPPRKGCRLRRSASRAAWRRALACETNLVDAAKWHLIAKSGGLSDESLDKILAKLSKADRTQGREGGRRWRDRTQIGIE